jgi:tetratricopeptide (TPR) repeat protein
MGFFFLPAKPGPGAASATDFMTKPLGRGEMYRVVLYAAGALLAFGLVVGPARADDRDTCDNGTGEEGIAACSRLIQRNQKDVVAWGSRAFLYNAKGDYDRAIADAGQAIRIDPKYAVAYNERGAAYNGKAAYNRAITDFDQAIQLTPDFPEAYYNRGNAYNSKGDYDRAIADLDQAIRLKPDIVDAYTERGFAHNGKGDYDQAIADLDQAIRLKPDYHNAYSHRGFAYGKKGDFDRAMTDLNRALALNAKYARGYSNRAAIHALRGDLARAIADVDEAIRLDPKDAFAYNVRGKAYFDKGQYAFAAVDFDQAIKFDPALTEARQNRERVQAVLALPQPGPREQAAAVPAKPPAVIPSAPPDRRIALVIGIGAYAHVPPLRNPIADARAVAEAFRRLGFAEVVEQEDLTRAALEKALKDFGDRAAAADWAVIYYAGHGVAMNGDNYLVPVDAELSQAGHVEDETVSLTRVLSKAERARRLRMVILDACRTNPFRLASADGLPRDAGRGLSPVEPARGVLVAFAARGGTTAADGGGEHSPFTQALLTHLETPNVDIGIMFRRVRDQVLARTGNIQEPFVYGSLPGEEFHFKTAGQ